MRGLFVAFLVGHAAVHAVMWTLPFTDATADMPFDPGHSWLLGDQRAVAVVAAGLVAVAYLATAVGWFGQTGWWPTTMLSASVMSLLLMGVFYAPWWLVGIAISGGLVVYALQAPS